MKQHSIAIPTLLALTCMGSPAFAEDGAPSSFRVSGFGTGALTWSDTDDAQFARPRQASGVGRTPRPGVDSNLGLQLDVKVNDWLSLTGQGVVRKDIEDDYGADATLAFAKFKVSDEVSVRAGRMAMAVFMISDFRHVGYANTMIRPSQEVYSQVPLNSIDGADIMWQKSFGDSTLTTQYAYGHTQENMVGGGKATVYGNSVLNVILEHGPLTLRFGRNDGKLALNAPFFKLPKTKVSFTAVGTALDWNNVVVQSEYTQARGVGVGSNAWYVMGGYRFGKLLPFYSHSTVTRSNPQSTDSIGLRWDAFRSADIKFQIDRVKPEGQGLFVNAKPGFHDAVTVGAVAVDFVF